MRLLLTGFEPFAGDTRNPSAELVAAIAAAPPRHLTLATCILPVAFARLDAALDAAIATARPDVVLSLGLAGGRDAMSVERIAINLDDARIPDNDGGQPLDHPVVADGPAAYFATVPVKAMVAAMRAAGAPAQVSHTAGTFACNHVFYRASHLAAVAAQDSRPAMRAGFIHLPYLPEQAAGHRRAMGGGVSGAGAPSMALATMLAGLRAAIGALAATADIGAAEGALH
jgi:pyroglutamyl-peptidase